MGLRHTVTPALSQAKDVTLEHVLAHLRQWQADTEGTRDALRSLREQVEASSRQLESPKAAFEYLEFFDGFFSQLAHTLGTVVSEVAGGFVPAHADRLRQLADNAAAEVRRTVQFRDKWVNKPLPYESTRPMLTRIASDVRDQLQDYRDLVVAASRLTALHAPTAPQPELTPEGRGRRELFTRLVRPLADVGDK